MCKVMLVEDEAIQATLLKSILKKSGHTVVGIFDNGKDAISNVKTLEPEVVLMDIMIKGNMDGIETCKRINTISNTAVIFVSGNSDRKTFEQAIQGTNNHGYISKPVDSRILLETIDAVITNFNKPC